MKLYKYYLLALGVIALDQTVKLLVHFNMEMGTAGEINVIGDWFKLHYLLNPGMAFGLKSSHYYGKLLLTLFRLGAMVGIGYYIYYLYKKGAKTGLLWCMGLILGGAVGNVIDSTFYGVFLNNAPIGSPTPWFHGQVIDMLFFPLFDGYYPDWMPGVGGNYFLFFSPVFNIADSSIFIGVVCILLFQKRFLKNKQNTTTITEDDSAEKETKPDNVIIS
ncbi:lipoprotein signal peptidase [Fulvivirga sediminis]|uniref:Lipoprotein signal peptidase n=1 Tax=Fulvivirga sediminis TaxID=2803949 RepID=A0A937K0J9_9BACT|nr:lipoprotein signal peptidase [Fulvivirga sediminis]MBL3657714.1 lipoprotein signal peptidase [Fulvivirga sediminis]